MEAFFREWGLSKKLLPNMRVAHKTGHFSLGSLDSKSPPQTRRASYTRMFSAKTPLPTKRLVHFPAFTAFMDFIALLAFIAVVFIAAAFMGFVFMTAFVLSLALIIKSL